MLRAWTTVLFLAFSLVAFGQNPKKHRDYVPDEGTARRIAEAVLVAQYGEDAVKAQLPLRVDSSNGDYWIVQLVGPEPAARAGGADIDFQCLRSAKLSAVRMAGRRSHAAGSEQTDDDGLADVNSNKSLSLCETASIRLSVPSREKLAEVLSVLVRRSP